MDTILLAQQVDASLRRGQYVPADLLSWYTATLHRWRQSLRSHRPLASEHPLDRPRIRKLLEPMLMNN